MPSPTISLTPASIPGFEFLFAVMGGSGCNIFDYAKNLN
jgi:hypothetical protein